MHTQFLQLTVGLGLGLGLGLLFVFFCHFDFAWLAFVAFFFSTKPTDWL